MGGDKEGEDEKSRERPPGIGLEAEVEAVEDGSDGS